MPSSMRALCYSAFGGGADALTHVEIPTPRPKKNELLVKVEASSINPVDWKIQKGMLRPISPGKFPFIPGTDIAGELVEIGASVHDFAVGDKVVSWLFIRVSAPCEAFTAYIWLCKDFLRGNIEWKCGDYQIENALNTLASEMLSVQDCD